MILQENARKALSLTGCGLWLAPSFMPWFGGVAKHEVVCRGHLPPTGGFDDCFNDYIPGLELTAPILAALLWYSFARFAVTIWAPPPALRRHAWRLASRARSVAYHPGCAICCVAGAGWCPWRAWGYPVDAVTLPYIAFWMVFAMWFAGAAINCRQDAEGAQDDGA